MVTLTLTTADLPSTPLEDGAVSPRSDLPRRRSFTSQYEADILTEYDAADPAAQGVLLRRERLYSSHLSEWRKARDNGALGGLSPVARSARKFWARSPSGEGQTLAHDGLADSTLITRGAPTKGGRSLRGRVLLRVRPGRGRVSDSSGVARE